MSLRRGVHTIHKESSGRSIGKRWSELERAYLLELVIGERLPLISAARELDRSHGGIKAQLVKIGLAVYQNISTPHCYMAPTIWKRRVITNYSQMKVIWTDSLIDDAIHYGLQLSTKNSLLLPADLAGKEVNEKFLLSDVKKVPPRYSHFHINGLSLPHR